MLKLLFGSETRIKLLNMLLLHAENRYTQAQLAGELQIASATIGKELANLTQFGLVSEIIIKEEKNIAKPASEPEKKGHSKKTKLGLKNEKAKAAEEKKYFIANKDFILYPEIKALFIKSQILSSQNFIINLEKNFQAKLVLLTGFFTNYPEAQTDLLIVGQIKRPSFLKLISELEHDLGREINFTIMDEREFRYRQEIMDIFLYNILEGKKIILIDTILDK